MSKTLSNKIDSNSKEKIIINKKSDLINIPIQQLRIAQIKNFSGVLFEQIYKEAIALEHEQGIKIKKYSSEPKEHSRPFNYKINIEDNYTENKTNKVIKIINKKLITTKENIIVINSINFEIKYDTTYGEEIGILGSITDLGNWNINNIFYLGWNYGNIWKGKIDINKPYINIEFKFVITFNREIKKWENGYNNRIIFDALLNEIRYKKNGFYDKYEYCYDNINKELYIKCRWN